MIPMSDESKGEQMTGEKKDMNHVEGQRKRHIGGGSTLETGCNTGALKSATVPGECPEKMSSLSVLLLQLAVKDISSAHA